MDLNKLPKEEQIAARVYIRRRRKAYEYYYDLQDLKIGNVVIVNRTLQTIVDIREPGNRNWSFDIVIETSGVEYGKRNQYGFSLSHAIGGTLQNFINQFNENRTDKYLNPYKLNLRKSKAGEVLYGKKA